MKARLSDNPKKVIVYTNGIKRKFKNKSVIVTHRKDNDSFHVNISGIYDVETILPSCSHKVLRGRVKKTTISFSRESFEAIIRSGLEIIAKEF